MTSVALIWKLFSLILETSGLSVFAVKNIVPNGNDDETAENSPNSVLTLRGSYLP